MPAAPLRTLFIVPSLRRAGAETQVVDLVNTLDATLFVKHLVSFGPQLDLLERVDTANVSFHRFPRAHKLDFSIVRRLARYIDEQAVDIVHCTLQISLLLGWAAIRLARRKPRLVVAIHTTLNRSTKEEFYDRVVYRPLIARCDRVVFVCEAQATHWKAKYPELSARACVVYNGVDVEAFHPDIAREEGAQLRARLGIGTAVPVLANIAGLRPEKGHDDLLEAFAACDEASRLLLAGEGPMRAAIEAQIEARGLRSRVHMLGEIGDVRPVLAAADLSILASTAVETFSIAMLESMAMGVPVVATDMGGLAEAIERGVSGEIVPPGRPAALAGTLRALIADPARLRTMGEAARSRVCSHFSREAMAQASATVFTEVATGARGDGASASAAAG